MMIGNTPRQNAIDDKDSVSSSQLVKASRYNSQHPGLSPGWILS